MRTKTFLLLFFLLFFQQLITAKVIFVNNTITNSNEDGTSWNNAHSNFQVAINEAVYGDTIWVAQGIYFPTDSTDREIFFELKNGIKWFGGFEGNETDLSQRDHELFPTVLSGDINTFGDSTDNSYHVVYTLGIDSTTVIDGFTIRDGHAEHTSPTYFGHYDYGGGMMIDVDNTNTQAYPKIRNCIFSHNYGLFGGGLSMGRFGDFYQISPQINNCKFITNHTSSQGGGIRHSGGQKSDNPQKIIDCIFSKNVSEEGGGIYFEDVNNEIKVVNCEFSGNQSALGGGVSFVLNFIEAMPIFISNCSFKNNSASSGSGVYFTLFGITSNVTNGGLTFEFSEFNNNISIGTLSEGVYIEMAFMSDQYNLKFDNTIFAFNEGRGITVKNEESTENGEFLISNSLFMSQDTIPIGTGYGIGGVGVYTQGNLNSNIENCIFHDNTLGIEQGNSPLSVSNISNCTFYKNKNHSISKRADTKSNITNSIFWEELQFEDIFISPDDILTEYYNIHHSLISTPDCIINGIDYCGEGMIYETYPMFRDTTNGDLSLLSCSPAINAGENLTIDSLNILFDFAGNPRIIDQTADMGAYETQAFEILVPQTVDVSCHEESDGSFSWVQHGTPPFTFEWINGTTTSILEFDSLSAGEYIVTITDADSCVGFLEVEIKEPAPLTLEGVINPISVFGGMDGAIEIIVEGGTPNYEYFWNTGEETATIDGLSAGVYTVTVIDANNCITMDSFEIEEPVSTIFPKDFFQVTIQPNLLLENEKGFLVFELKENEVFEISLLDVFGKILWHDKLNIHSGISNVELPSTEASGIYFIQVKNSKNQSQTLRIVSH